MELLPLSRLPDWSNYRRVSLDIETKDPMLTKLGPGVRRGDGFVAGISFACDDGKPDCPAFYLPIRHKGGGNYPVEQVYRYLRAMSERFEGDLVTANGQYDLDWLAEDGVTFTPRFFRDVQISGPLLLEPRCEFNREGQLAEVFQHMNLDALAAREGLPGKDESELAAWADAHGLNLKSDMWQFPARMVSKYAIQDARLPLQIIKRHERRIEEQGLQTVYDLECELLPVLLEMRRVGVAVNTEKVSVIEEDALRRERAAFKELHRCTGVQLTEDDTNKSAALAKAIEAAGYKVPRTATRISEKTGKQVGGTPSITAAFLGSLSKEGVEAAKWIQTAKKWNKVRTTFCKSVLQHTVRGRIHCTFNQLRQERETGETKGAEFGRLSCTDPNLQQQPARDKEIGPLWRSIYVPDDGGEWACLDFSSQEPRLITHYAEVTALMGQMSETGREAALAAAEACRTDPKWDNHGMMAGFINGEDYVHAHYTDYDKADDGSPEQKLFKVAKGLRGDAKIIFLGTCYGMGGGKLCRSLGLPVVKVIRDPNARGWVVYQEGDVEYNKLAKQGCRPFEMAGPEGQAIIEKFNTGVPYIKELSKMAMNKAKKAGFVTSLLGRRCRLPKDKNGQVHFTHKALNRLIQGSAADQTKMAMVLAHKAGIRLQLQVHDELDLTIWDRKEAEELNEIMVHAVELKVPTKCDIETGPTWGEIK